MTFRRQFIHHSKAVRAAFTLIELLVVIAIVALLISILLPALQSAREMARQVQCQANHRQLNILLTVYNNEYGGYFPSSTNDPSNPSLSHPTWLEQVEAMAGPHLNDCPGGYSMAWQGDTYGGDAPHVMDELQGPIAPNGNLMSRNDQWQTNAWKHINMIRVPSKVMTYVDNADARYAGGWHPGEWLRFRHAGGTVIVLSFLDGHAGYVTYADAIEHREGQGTINALISGNIDQHFPWGDNDE